jgi:hypothetical protein
MISMARLWRNQDKHTEARQFLASVYGWFTERFDTRWQTHASSWSRQPP